MRSLGFELRKTFGAMNPDVSKYLYIARNKTAYVNAIVRVCAPNAAMAGFILRHTNAFYVRRDNAVKVGPAKDKPYILCEVCVDDAVVRSEINMRQEVLRLALALEGITFDEFRIISAKGGMRSRHPFLEEAKAVEEGAYEGLAGLAAGREDVSGTARAAEKLKLLELLKRALIISLGDVSDEVLECIEAADVVRASFADADAARRSYRSSYFVRLYSSDERTRAVLAAEAPSIVSHARELRFWIRRIQVEPASADMEGHRAFPRVGVPESFFGF